MEKKGNDSDLEKLAKQLVGKVEVKEMKVVVTSKGGEKSSTWWCMGKSSGSAEAIGLHYAFKIVEIISKHTWKETPAPA